MHPVKAFVASLLFVAGFCLWLGAIYTFGIPALIISLVVWVWFILVLW